MSLCFVFQFWFSPPTVSGWKLDMNEFNSVQTSILAGLSLICNSGTCGFLYVRFCSRVTANLKLHKNVWQFTTFGSSVTACCPQLWNTLHIDWDLNNWRTTLGKACEFEVLCGFPLFQRKKNEDIGVLCGSLLLSSEV